MTANKDTTLITKQMQSRFYSASKEEIRAKAAVGVSVYFFFCNTSG
jgi:hypothetical protein